MKKLIFIYFAFNAFYSFNQVNDGNLSGKEKAEYVKLVYSKCTNADILEIQQKEDYIEVEYMCNGVYYEMGINDGEILFQETKALDTDMLYSKIQQKLGKKYAGWLLDEITLISTSDTSFLKVEILKEGLEQNLFFTIDGKWYKSKSMAISDKWNLDILNGNSIFKNTHYDFLQPNEIYELPQLLREISGLTIIDENSVFCVQDELGAVFQYNFKQEQIEKLIRFTDVGDFEAITKKGDTLFVLRSDGMLFSLDKNRKLIKQNMIAMSELNYESITYDKNNFLFVSKDVAINKLESIRTVYKMDSDLQNEAIELFEIDINEITQLLKKAMPSFESHDFSFNPSDIAVHPITQEVYVLSASDRILSVFDKGILQRVYPLPAELYFKPEGIAFYENGDMLISNEGDKRGLVKGNILLLKNRKKPL